MTQLDHEIMEEVRERALVTRSLADRIPLSSERDRIRNKIMVDLTYIKIVCREEGIDWKPFGHYYYDIYYGRKR